ncbi:flagellar hook-associated protein 1 FlgK [Formivibrio citricus]|uniref:Flagellar hook-associated protein 1 n=1 Tax=Formivibrio citricus TaxID=83765 RepID=A0A1I4ZWE7_9NEIS|nr:flagellar hook-associated protein FlgK [Formivibrio citricus]SFN54537.1 flagellar hook-associated protein 1 FlgK [Formivibrio citricus]
MGSSVYGIAVTGLNAANLGLTTAGHNIANANTEGYSRQTITQSAPYPQGSGSGYVGLGVRVDTIVRAYDRFAVQQLNSAQTKSSYYEAYLDHVQEIDNIVADSSTGISPALQDFFSAVQNVATNPSDTASRQTLLSMTQTLVNRFQTFDQRLTEMRDSLNGEITDAVSSINSYGKQIADLNNQIVVAQSAGQPPNDLLDKRDQMVLELNKLVKASTVSQPDGSINVFIGSGQSLVTGGTNFSLVATQALSDPRRITVGYTQQNGSIVYLPENLLGGGQLGALLDYRSKSLDVAQNSLAQVAVGLAENLNKQQQVGMDLYGNAGKTLFSYNTTTVGTATPPAIGSIQAFSTNTGTGALTGYIQDTSQLTNSDFELSYDATSTNYTLTKLTDGTKTTITAANMTAGYVVPNTGLFLQMAGAPANNDRFSIRPYSGFVNSLAMRMTDPREVAAAQQVRAQTKNFSLVDGSLSASTNTGTAKVTSLTVDSPSTVTTSAATDPNLQDKVGIRFTSATQYTLYDMSGAAPVVISAGNTYTSGTPIELNGWNLTLNGVPATGDQFVIVPNTGGSEDNGNALQMAGLQTSKKMLGSSATYQDTYGSMVATIGTQTNEAKIMSEAQETVLSQAQDKRDSISGVNLDEEAASLLRYQQAYMAASKVIQIAQKAFDQLMTLGS